MQGSTRTVLTTALGPALWGTTYYATTSWLPAGYPILDGAVRALPAGLIILALTRRLPHGVWIWRMVVLGMLNIGLFFPLLFLAASRLPGGIAGAVGAAQPLLVLMMSTVLLHRRASAAAVACGLAGVFGVTLLVVRAGGDVDAIGLVAAIAGTTEVALAIVLAKRWGSPPMSPLATTGWLLTVGGVFLTPLAMVSEGLPAHLSGVNVFGFAYIAVLGGAVSYFLWTSGVNSLPASAVSFLMLVVPVVSATLGWVALGQALAPLQLLGMAIALGSLVVGQRVLATGTAPVRAERVPTAPGRMTGCQPPAASRRRVTSRSRRVGVSRLD